MFGLGMQELVIVGIVAVLLFGKRLPEVARSMGKSYNEFRKGLTDIQTSIDYSEPHSSASSSGYSSSAYGSSVGGSAGGDSAGGDSAGGDSAYDDYDESEEPTAPKFEPPSSEPVAEAESEAE